MIQTITGTIADLREYGSIVLIFLDADDGRVVPVTMECRAFRHLLEGEGCRAAELVGRSVAYDGDLVVFLD